MNAIHALGATVVLVAAALFAVGSAGMAMAGGSRWVDRGRLVVLGLVGLVALAGAFAWLSGSRPAESLHYLYAVAALATLPLAASFATEAPPRERAAVMAGTGLVLILLVWRLASTG